MSECFPNVPTPNVEQFFRNMVLSDLSMPHTPSHLSPITFMDFLTRNGIMTYNPGPIYVSANNVWKDIQKYNPSLLQMEPRRNYPLEQAETKHEGWNIIIDYFRRALEVETMQLTIYQMHYLAHLSREFYDETFSIEDNQKKTAYRTVFNSLMQPMLYDALIPANYFYLPIRNCNDAYFMQGVKMMTEGMRMFIQTHSAATINFKVYDRMKMDLLRKDIDETLTALSKAKYKPTEVWAPAVSTFLNKVAVYRTDLELCELSETFARDNMECMQLMLQIDKFRKRFEEHRYDDDADMAIDHLLDIRPRKKPVQATTDFIKNTMYDLIRRPFVKKEKVNEKSDSKRPDPK